MPDSAGDQPRIVETHISLLFFVDDRVYKIRKPVRFGFLDFSDRAAREEDCRREVELNRRLAPDVYLGVADLTMHGVPVEHMVVMRALPQDRKLTELVRSGAPVTAWLDRVAAVLASFHAGAERSEEIARAGAPQVRRSEWEANFAETQRFVGSILDPTAEAEIRATALAWLARNETLLEDRVRDGHICDGHGDLQADDIFCLDEGVRILDCLEFSDALRQGDVCADVAFLAMDLERLGDPGAADHFVAAYVASTGTDLPPALLHHYVGLRAYVRAKVACLAYEQGAPGADDSARALHDLALRHLRQTRRVLVLVGGLPGSGKTTLAAGLASRTGWSLLRSDEIRRTVADVGDPYAPSSVGAVYEELIRQARALLADGQGVILDASWVDASHRSLAARAAAEAGSELVQLYCICDDVVAASRLAARQAEGLDASEATAEIRELLAGRADPWPGATVVDTSDQLPDAALASALEALAVPRPDTGTLVPPSRHVGP